MGDAMIYQLIISDKKHTKPVKDPFLQLIYMKEHINGSTAETVIGLKTNLKETPVFACIIDLSHGGCSLLPIELLHVDNWEVLHLCFSLVSLVSLKQGVLDDAELEFGVGYL
jgi:hypothetical protein